MAGGAATNVGAGAGDAELLLRRRLMDQAFRNQQGAIQDAYAQLLPLLQARASGADVPFGEAGRQALRADVTDSTGAQQRAAGRTIDRGFATATGGGASGGAIAAKQAAQREASAAARQGVRDVNVRTQVEDFGAKERGQSALAAAEAQKLAALSDYLRQFTGYTSNFESTNAAQKIAQAMAGGRPGGAGAGGLAMGGGSGGPAEVAAAPGLAYQTQPMGGGYDPMREALRQQTLAAQRAAYYGSLPEGLGDYGGGGTVGRVGGPSGDYGGGYAYPASLGPRQITSFSPTKSGGFLDNNNTYYPPSDPKGNFFVPSQVPLPGVPGPAPGDPLNNGVPYRMNFRTPSPTSYRPGAGGPGKAPAPVFFGG